MPTFHRVSLRAVDQNLRRAAALVIALLTLGVSTTATAEPDQPAPAARAKNGIPQAPIGLSNLIIRIDGQDEIGLAGADYRIRLIERLRELGFNAVGAESLVFDKDESNRAVFRLGGIVRELECRKPSSGIRCRIGVEWQLLNVERDVVVYKVTSRSAVLDVPRERISTIASRLLLGALEALAGREEFRKILATSGDAEPTATDPPLAAATYGACAPVTGKMPAASEQVLRATVVVDAGTRFGSGFFLTPDGLVITAAHVVESATRLRLRLRDGSRVDAVVVRIAKNTDVALLRVTSSSASRPCLVASANGDPSVGTELYAAGAPASVDLAFSLTRGIVSALRDFNGHHILQTDAPVNQGNSGGPMVNLDGEAIAVANSKLAGRTVEGIAFGIPIATALSALGLASGAQTDASLLTGTWTPPASEPEGDDALTDTPDPVPSLDPEADRRREEEAAEQARLEQEREDRKARDRVHQQRLELRDRATPTYVKVMYWGGMGVGIAGGATAIYAYTRYDDVTTTHKDYQRLTVINTAGWAALGLGAAAVTTAIILRPPLPDAPETTARPASQLIVGPGSVRWEGSF